MHPAGVVDFTVSLNSCSAHYTHHLSKRRLQVVLDQDEYEEIESIVRRHRVRVSEWVRRSLRRARRSEPWVEAGRKLELVRQAVQYEFPTAEIDRMLREIESGYSGYTA